MLKEGELDERISTILQELSVQKGSMSFDFMAQAIKNEYHAQISTKKPRAGIYAKLTEQFAAPATTVFYYLRLAVSNMYSQWDVNRVTKYFGKNSIFEKKRPGPARVIKELARYIIKEEEKN